MWKKKTGQEPSRRITTEPSCSKSLSRFACSHPTLILFQSAALLSPPLLSTTLSSFALFPSPSLCYFQTENGRWANAIHSLTKGNLGVLQQGSDRLVPQARSASPLTLPPAGALCVSNLLTHSLTHTQTCVQCYAVLGGVFAHWGGNLKKIQQFSATFLSLSVKTNRNNEQQTTRDWQQQQAHLFGKTSRLTHTVITRGQNQILTRVLTVFVWVFFRPLGCLPTLSLALQSQMDGAWPWDLWLFSKSQGRSAGHWIS